MSKTLLKEMKGENRMLKILQQIVPIYRQKKFLQVNEKKNY